MPAHRLQAPVQRRAAPAFSSKHTAYVGALQAQQPPAALQRQLVSEPGAEVPTDGRLTARAKQAGGAAAPAGAATAVAEAGHVGADAAQPSGSAAPALAPAPAPAALPASAAPAGSQAGQPPLQPQQQAEQQQPQPQASEPSRKSQKRHRAEAEAAERDAGVVLTPEMLEAGSRAADAAGERLAAREGLGTVWDQPEEG